MLFPAKKIKYINMLNPVVSQENYTAWPSGIETKHEKRAHCSNINYCGPLHQYIKAEKNTIVLTDAEKAFNKK